MSSLPAEKAIFRRALFAGVITTLVTVAICGYAGMFVGHQVLWHLANQPWSAWPRDTTWRFARDLGMTTGLVTSLMASVMSVSVFLGVFSLFSKGSRYRIVRTARWDLFCRWSASVTSGDMDEQLLIESELRGPSTANNDSTENWGQES